MRVTFTGVRLCANNDSPVAHFAPATIASVGIQPSINTPHSALFIAVPISWQSSGGVSLQTEDEHREPGRDRDVLLAVDRVRHGEAANLPADLHVPQRLAR